ncbi:hypothetical protein B8T70_02580 [Flavobacterium sp. AJR]|nr:hypothetical protein B8T70_02580 [Flavobacterium sp. AJR]
MSSRFWVFTAKFILGLFTAKFAKKLGLVCGVLRFAKFLRLFFFTTKFAKKLGLVCGELRFAKFLCLFFYRKASLRDYI